ncbi:response regulator [Desulfosporosinus sp. PR]|uniref:response regulator n=1 Tax=Candidatus Desulfosporosinus nitrosoreducens TaxID=3401928 RepID=UPI0027F0169C|nr:response regulator [Desulfosporosinus sp. PR]MDQ7097142.1 response regulator [Desulfosporosinus sp. PR]
MNYDYLLVVDDHAGIRRLLREFLTQEGFCIKEAPDGQTALQLVKERKPRLVLLDLKMPGLNGLETLSKLKQLCPRTLVILMSAYTRDKAVMAAVQNGSIQYYIYKPFDLEELRLILQRLLNNVGSNILLKT